MNINVKQKLFQHFVKLFQNFTLWNLTLVFEIADEIDC